MLLLIFISLMISCRETETNTEMSQAERACVYNDRIVLLQHRLDSARQNVSVSISERNPSATSKSIEKLKSEIRILLDSLNAIPDFDGDSSLRIAAAGLFRIYLSDADHIRSALPVLFTNDEVDTLHYTDTINFSDSIDPNEGLISVYERSVRRSKKEQLAFDYFFEAQNAFAKKYGFVLAR